MSTSAISTTPAASAATGHQPRALVLRAAGVNCDAETVHAFRLAGADPHTLHVNRLAETPRLLDDFDLLAIPGGFSYGDDIAAGRILSDQLNRTLGDALRRFVDRGRPVIGICNGFQVLVQTSLLPGDVTGNGERICALTENVQGRFICRWVTLNKVAKQCVWTSTWGDEEAVELPIAHAEGRLVCREGGRELLRAKDRIALTYTRSRLPLPPDMPENPNGTVDDIAGLCDESGLVLGLMPHPERYVDVTQHPAWTRRKYEGTGEDVPAGLRLFQGAVAHVTTRR